MSSSEHFVWAVDGKPVSVHLSADVVRFLEPRARGGSDGREPEIGGLLLGRVQQANDSWIVAVEAVELVPCEHARGGSWTLSRSDREVLAKRIQRQSKRDVVGWFRTHTRPGLYLDDHDFGMFRDYFGHPASVALAVRPDGEAGFFIWEDGEVERTRPYATFSLRAEALQFSPAQQPVRAASTSRTNVPNWLLWTPVAVALLLAVVWTGPTPFEAEDQRSRTYERVQRPVFAPPPPEEGNVVPAAAAAPPVATKPEPAVAQPAPLRTAPQVMAKSERTPAAPPPMAKAEPPRVAPAAVAEAKPARPPVVKSAVNAIPQRAPGKKSGPVATRKVEPKTFSDPFPVRVKVKIDRDGYVRSAHLLTTAASADTAMAVMRAARGWKFKPARQENRSVESEMVLTFEP